MGEGCWGAWTPILQADLVDPHADEYCAVGLFQLVDEEGRLLWARLVTDGILDGAVVSGGTEWSHFIPRRQADNMTLMQLGGPQSCINNVASAYHAVRQWPLKANQRHQPGASLISARMMVSLNRVAAAAAAWNDHPSAA